MAWHPKEADVRHPGSASPVHLSYKHSNEAVGIQCRSCLQGVPHVATPLNCQVCPVTKTATTRRHSSLRLSGALLVTRVGHAGLLSAHFPHELLCCLLGGPILRRLSVHPIFEEVLHHGPLTCQRCSPCYGRGCRFHTSAEAPRPVVDCHSEIQA